MRTLLLLTLVVQSALASSPEAILLQEATPQETCEFQLLKELGWRAEAAPANALRSETSAAAANVCQATSLEEARAQGALRISIRTNAPSAELAALRAGFADLLKGDASDCGYRQLVSDAATRATEKLSANPLYRYVGGLQMGFVQFKRGPLLDHDAWRGAGVPLKFIYYPKSSVAEAVEQYYLGKIHNDCAAGLQAAEMATLYELFGRDSFDASFAPNELPIGSFKKVEKSESLFHGKGTPRLFDPNAEILPKIGAAALAGIGGYIGNVFGRKYVDHRSDQGENFLILSASADAANALATAGSIASVNDRMKLVWGMVRASANPKAEAQELYDDRLETMPEEGKSETHRAVDAVLSAPEFTGIRVYVHDGNREEDSESFRYHVKRLLKLNPRTPYAVRLYSTPMPGEIFERFKRARIDACLARAK